jgi:hypothetical protein
MLTIKRENERVGRVLPSRGDNVGWENAAVDRTQMRGSSCAV